MQKLALVNSQQKFTLDDHFSMRINRIQMPSGGKSNRRVHTHDLADRINSSKSVVKITLGSNLCLPACLVLGRLFHTTDTAGPGRPKWKKMTDRRVKSHLEAAARQFIEKCGFTSKRKFNIAEDLEKFQTECVPDCRIIVVDQSSSFVKLKVFPDDSVPMKHEIYLLYFKAHFDLITSPQGTIDTLIRCSKSLTYYESVVGWLMKAQYCSKCRVGYDKKGKHHCDGTCPKCYRLADECKVTDQKYCGKCDRTFRNDDCFEIHARVPPDGRSFCQKFFVCNDCEGFVNMSNRKLTDKH